jgi:hypothetical protein
MTPYELYLYLLMGTKLVFVEAVVENRIRPSEASKKRITLSDNIFKVAMALLLVYLFHPYAPNTVTVDHETKLFLFTFALLTIFDFFKEEYKEYKKEESN